MGGTLKLLERPKVAPRPNVAPHPAEELLRRRRFRESLRVVLDFRHEQTDPDRFYRQLAADTVRLVGQFAPVSGRLVADVGSGPGDLAEAFRQAGARALALDVDFEEMHCRPRDLAAAVVADAASMPFPHDKFDIVCSSNVMEHVPDPVSVVQEMARIVRPGGLVFVNYTVWLSPWGGHETAPWHYVGGDWAMRRYERKNGKPPKNRYGSSMFALGVKPFLHAVRRLEGLKMIDAFPRYLPRWTRPLVRIPGLREVLTWNLVVALRRLP